MNQTSQQRGESQYYNLWFEAKKFLKTEQKHKDILFKGFSNYNPMKHCERQSN